MLRIDQALSEDWDGAAMAGARVLVVESDPRQRRVLTGTLAREGFDVRPAPSGELALIMLDRWAPDVLLLDLALPGLSGLDVCRELRRWSQTPIIVLSVENREQQKIAALDLGADDYLTKPFGIGELLARIRATIRRTKLDSTESLGKRAIGDLTIDFGARTVTRAGTPIHLTPTEFDLLAYLAQHEGKVLTHRMVLTSVWGPGYGDQILSLRVMITQLRKKIEVDPARPRLIVTEPGVGYRFQSQP